MTKFERGSLIVFEGSDRSGKTTQVEKLVEKLNREGMQAERMRFPDRTKAIGSAINSPYPCQGAR